MKKINEPKKEMQSKGDDSYDLTRVGDAANLDLLSKSGTDHEETADSPVPNSQSDRKIDTPTAKNSAKEDADPADAEEEKAEEENEEEKEEKKAGEENPAALATRLLQLAISLIQGTATDNDLLKLLDAERTKEEIEHARLEGIIEGRNAAIEEHLQPSPVRVPDLSAPATSVKPAVNSIFELAMSAK